MIINYAGIDLLWSDQSLFTFTNKRLSFNDLAILAEPIAYSAGYLGSPSCDPSIGLPIPNYPPKPKFKLNCLYYPTGASRWATFFGIANKQRAKQIISAVQGSSAPSAAPLKLGKDPEIKTNMYLLPPRIVSAVNDDLWIIPLVDERYYWQLKHVATEIEITDTSSADWSEVYSGLGTALGVDIDTQGGISSNYKKADAAELSRRCQNAAVILDAVAHTTGRRICRKLDGSIVAKSWSNSSADFAANINGATEILAGGQFGDALDSPAKIDGIFPNKVIVAYPKYESGFRDSGNAYHTVEKTGSKSGVSGTSKLIRTSARADFTGGSIQNSSDVDDLATAIKNDFYLSISKQYDITFAGLSEWESVGYDNYVEWDCQSGQTRVQSVPYNFGIEEMGHAFDYEAEPSCRNGIITGITDSDISVGATGIISLVDDTGSDNSINVTGYHFPTGGGQEISGNKAVHLNWNDQHKRWYIVAEGCT